MMFNLKDAFFVPSAKYPTQLEWEDFFLIRLYQIAHYTKSPRTGTRVCSVRKKKKKNLTEPRNGSVRLVTRFD